jgi:hypothetical protein
LIAAGIVGTMFGFTKKHSTVTVEFVESGQNKPFAASKVPIAQLPDSFEAATTLDIADKKWSVVDAAPKNKTEFEKSGKLRVVLAPLQMMNPKDILFSLPTINDRMFPVRKVSSLEGMLVIHEDDWRQIEFVSEKLTSDVEKEIQSIRSIYETKRKGMGFTGVHIRKLIEQPIDEDTLPYDAVKKHFTITKEFGGFGGQADGQMGIAENGFAFETTDGHRFFGILSQKRNVVFLCMAGADGFNEECKDLMKSFHLLCVDWCKGQVVTG